MRVSKSINQLVDNDTYWTRVAAHLVWRDCECMGVKGGVHVLPHIPHDLYYMDGHRGYYWTMERFLQRMEEVIAHYSEGWCENVKSMSLEERTRFWMRGVACSRMGEQLEGSMKEVARVESAACVKKGFC